MAGDFELGEDWGDEWLDLDPFLIDEVLEDFIDDFDEGGYL